MLTIEDIKKLTEYLKEVFVTKDDFEKFEVGQRANFSKLQASLDAIALDNRNKSQEMPTLNRRVKEVENWIDKASPKLGIKFKH